MRKNLPFSTLGTLLAGACFLGVSLPVSAQNAPPFGDTAGTVFDIIKTSDPTTFHCLESTGRSMRQIWDKRVDGEPEVNAFTFAAHYTDGTNVTFAINPEFATETAAQAEAMHFAVPLGRLPTVLRAGIEKFSVHKGNHGFHAGTGQIIGYSGTARQRESYNHFEETLFHEAVHASLDDTHRLADAWKKAQDADGGFLTEYGRRSPEREDLAETALFAFAILHHPDRFPPVDTDVTRAAVPARIAYIADIFPADAPLTYQVAAPQTCSS